MRRLGFALLIALLVAAVVLANRARHRPLRAERVMAHVNLANAAMYDWHFGQAIAHYRAALVLDPRMHYARQALATAYEHTGKHTLAIRELEAGVKADPRSVAALQNLGFAHFLAHNYRAALPIFQTCARLEPDNAYWHNFVGRCYWGVGDKLNACRTFRHVLKLDPANGVARYHLTACLSGAPPPFEVRAGSASPSGLP